MKKILISIVAGTLLALAVSFFSHKDGWDNLRFHMFSSNDQNVALKDTIKLFNKLYAHFYDTGGRTEGLNEFPAANLVKRRIFQDIAQLRKDGKWLIYDLHETEFSGVDIVSRKEAVVETGELWDMWIKDIKTGERAGRKQNAIKVRYHLGYERERWIVKEYEVFSADEELPGPGTGSS